MYHSLARVFGPLVDNQTSERPKFAFFLRISRVLIKTEHNADFRRFMIRTIVRRTNREMVKAKKFIYAKVFDGMPTPENFQLVEEELRPIKDGEFLLEALYLSVDPYMRAYSARYVLGQTMIGAQVAKILESKNEKFPVGKYVVGQYGWRTHTIADGTPPDATRYPPYLVPETEGIPLSLHLGVLGRPGNSAYFGLLDICKPKSGETIVVSAAAGAVGNHVGQIGKILGCTVIGFTSTQEKSDWLKTLGFDHVINYKTEDVKTALTNAAPKGVDCYFDNVGGEISSIVLHQMNRYGRIAVCGSVSSYNAKADEVPKATIIQRTMVTNELEMKGFIVVSWLDRWTEGVNQNIRWLKEGKLKYRETLTEGFENMPQALIGVLSGDNFGKSVVKV